MASKKPGTFLVGPDPRRFKLSRAHRRKGGYRAYWTPVEAWEALQTGKITQAHYDQIMRALRVD